MSGVQGLLSALRKKDVRIRVEGNELRVDAPKGALTQLDLRTLRENKPSLIAFLKSVDTEKLVSPIQRHEHREAPPLSFAQQRLWFIDQLEGAGAAYHLPGSARLHGALNLEALQSALDSLVERHEALRTTFSSIDGNPVQVIAARGRFPLKHFDLTGLPADERETEVARLGAEEAQTRFDLSVGPLIRGRLIRVGAEEHVLLLMMHHIVSDGWSMGVLINDLAKLYTAHCEGRRNPLVPLPIQYADYAIWQRSWLRDEAIDQQLSYWKRQLSGAPELLDLPKDRPRLETRSYGGDTVDFMVGAELTRQLNKLALAHDATLFMVLCTAFSILLSRLSGQDDVVIGTPVANRQRVELEPLVGFFVNTLTLRIRPDTGDTVATLLRQVREVTLGAYDHQDLPFEQVVDALQPRRALNHSPLFQAMFVLQNTPKHEISVPGLRLAPQGVANNTAKFDLRVSLFEAGGQIFGDFNYSSELFDRQTISRWTGYFHALLAAMVQDANMRVGDMPLLDDRERQQLVSQFNSTRQEYPRHRLIHELFEAQVEREPMAIAAVTEAGQLTYGELNERANQLAHRLRELGVAPDRRVALCFERSLEMVVGLLGILKAGGAYVPLDPSYPRERLEYMLKDAAPAVLLTQECLKSLFSDANVARICLDSQWEEIGRLPKSNLLASSVGLDSSHLAYVIYTSGSTGQPKGVMVEHASVVNLWTGLEQGIYRHEARCQRVGVNASFAFDASVKQWVQLLSGRTLVLVPDAVRWDAGAWLEFVQRQAVDAIDCTPSQLSLLAGSGLLDGRPGVPAVMLVGGEAIDATLWARLAASRHVTFYNVYGPTECTVDATIGRIRDLAVTPSLGRPIANAQIHILDGRLQPVPIGVTGEIHIGGAGVARGYLNRPELTAERFIPDPFNPAPSARIYKSGDLGRYRPDGTIEYLGRNDHQVKIRGFRIELGEIEAKLAGHPGVVDAVVLAREDVPGDRRLVAYLTHGDPAPGNEELRTYLTSLLPDYMIPSAYVLLDRLPLTANGKLDRRALPAPELGAYASRTYEAPQGPAEIALAAIWQELLQVERVGRHDNFFELGGHSLLIMQLIERLRRQGFKAEVRSMFESASLMALARSLTSTSGSAFQAPPNLIPADCTAITPAMLPLIELTPEQIDRIVDAVPGGAANIQDIYPLAPLQEGILFHHLLNQHGDTYVMPTLLTSDSRDELNALLDALQRVIDRHDIWRTSVLWKGLPRAVQVVHRRAALSVKQLELAPAMDVAAQLRERMAPGRLRIDLQSAPLIRVEIAPAPDGQWYALLYYHHIISDHLALEQILREVNAHLAGASATLSASIPYREYVAHALARTKTHDATAFFRSRLRDIDEPTAPFGLLDTQGDGSRIEEARQAVDAELARRIRRCAQHLNVSAATLFHAAYALVIAQTSNRDDVVFGSVLLGRLQALDQIERMLGMFINTLPLRLSLKELNARQLIERVQGELAQLLDYEHASLAEAQRCSGIVGNAPLFTAVLNYRHSAAVAVPQSKEQVASSGMRTVASYERTNYPFLVSVDDLGEGFAITAQIDRQVGSRRVVEYVHTAMESLVRALEQRATGPVRALPILPSQERDRLLSDFNATAVEYPKDRLIHELFEDQVRRTPDAVAVKFDSQQVTYRELNERSNQLAHHLRELGVGPDRLAAICVERSVEMVVGLLGILKAGGAYVPLDPSYPRERLEYMLKDAAPVVLLTQESLIGSLPGCGARLIALDSQWSEIARQPSHALKTSELGLSLHHLAYVIYTSGSTGQPKGAMNEHGAVVNRLLWMQQAYELTPDDRVMQKTPFSFDVSVWEFFWTLLNGARLVVARPQGHQDPAYLSGLIAKEGITTMHFVPSMLQVFLEHGGAGGCDSLRQVICSGEALPVELQNRCLEQLPQAKLHNLYGPTEAAIDVTYWECRPEPGQSRVPIGRPIANTRIYILDQQHQPVPIAVMGEIHIGGVAVARGYWNRPELTAERFIADPFSVDPNARMYRTGDLGRYRVDGTIEYLGRNDHQVKIRGFRIELGEIEARLAEHPQVREAVVLAREDAGGDKRLVAYLTHQDQKPDLDSLRAYLKPRLPEYMVPSAYVLLESLPLNANGKLDRKALPAPELGAYSTRAYEAPRGQIETILAGIWQDLLQVERVGRHDNFFELGGHSLLIVRLIERLRQQGLEADVRSVFNSPGLSALASSLSTAPDRAFQAPPNLIPAGCTAITPAMLPLIELTQEQIDRIVSAVPGGAANVQDLYPLAPVQEGILFHHVLNERRDTYVRSTLMALDSREQLDTLLEAIQAVIDRHDVLRTAIHWRDLPRAVQVVYRHGLLPLKQLEPGTGTDAVAGLKARLAPGQLHIDLQSAPLIRAEIARSGNGSKWYLLLYYHHIISDHVALEQVLREVDAHVAGTSATLRTPIPYREYVAHALSRAQTHDANAFFRSRLNDIDEPTAPFALLDVQGDGSRIAESQRVLDAHLSQRIRRCAHRMSVGAATLFHAAYALVIANTSNREDVVFGSVLLGRLQGLDQVARMLGMFINTLPLRVSLRGLSARALVGSMHEELAQLLNHEHASLAEAQRCSGITGNAPLFTAVLNYRHSAPSGAPAGEPVESSAGGLSLLASYGRTNYPFTVSVDDLGEVFRITAQIDRQVDAQRVAAYVCTAIESLVQALEDGAQAPVQTLSILPPEERRRLLIEFNATAVEYPNNRLLHELFEEQARQTPDAVALIFESQQLTYRELDERSNRLAHYLRERGIGPDRLVAICVERSIEMVVGLLGILKAGGAYVPLDPAYPRERLEYMLRDAAASVVLTQESLRSSLPAGEARLIALDSQWPEIAEQPTRALSGAELELTSRHLAYVIYTSGSTGQPKGAMNEHGAVVNRLHWMQQAYQLTPDDRVVQKTPFSFDVSVWEFFWTLSNGACLVIARPQGHQDPEYLRKLFEDQGVTTAHFVPSMLQVFLEHAGVSGQHRLRQVICSGEALPVELQNRCLERLPRAKLHNLYGPTEAAIDVTYWECRNEPGQMRVPIGRPIANTQIYILDPQRRPVPIGVTGEIHIGGVGVARGYLNRPELTAERFIADPFSSHPNARMYKTGDLGCYRVDGTIEYLGRNDHQVKIRGFRIELGEIEAKLAQHPQVREAVVLAREDVPGEKRLVAYLTHTEPAPGSEELRRHLKPQLPEYMVPSAYVLLEKLPLSANGKLDRKALPAPEIDAYSTRAYEAPQGEIETALATIWQDLLRVERVGRHDNFFELGGHSLLAVKMLAAARRSLAIEIPMRTIFEAGNLAGLGQLLRTEEAMDEEISEDGLI